MVAVGESRAASNLQAAFAVAHARPRFALDALLSLPVSNHVAAQMRAMHFVQIAPFMDSLAVEQQLFQLTICDRIYTSNLCIPIVLG